MDKRANPLKKHYTEDEVQKGNQRYIIYALDSLVKQVGQEQRMKQLGVDTREFSSPVSNNTKALIARLITPHLADLETIVSVITFWVNQRVVMLTDPKVTRIMLRDVTDITDVESLLVHLYNI